MQESKVTIDGGKSNITINIVINGNDAVSNGQSRSGKSCDEEVAAAISTALADYLGGDADETVVHDKESFVITIRPYDTISSPWGAKAYTFRQAPQYTGPFSPLTMDPMRFRPEFR